MRRKEGAPHPRSVLPDRALQLAVNCLLYSYRCISSLPYKPVLPLGNSTPPASPSDDRLPPPTPDNPPSVATWKPVLPAQPCLPACLPVDLPTLLNCLPPCVLAPCLPARLPVTIRRVRSHRLHAPPPHCVRTVCTPLLRTWTVEPVPGSMPSSTQMISSCDSSIHSFTAALGGQMSSCGSRRSTREVNRGVCGHACVCVCVCVHACTRACVYVCARACVCVCAGVLASGRGA